MSYFFKESSKRLSVAFIELNFVFLKKKKDVNHDLCTLPACCLLLLLTLSMQKKSISSPPIHFLWNAFSPVLKRRSGRFLVLGCCTIALHWRCILLPISHKIKWNKKHILSIFFLNSKFSDLWWLTPVPKKHVQNCNSLIFFYFFFFLYGAVGPRDRLCCTTTASCQRRTGRTPSFTISQPLQTQLLPCSAAAASSTASAGGRVFNHSNLTYHHHHHHQEDDIISAAISTIITATS